MNKYILAIGFLSIVFSIILFGQEEMNLFPTRYTVGISIGTIPQRLSVVGNDTYQSKWWNVHGGFSVWKNIESTENKSFQQIMFFGNVRHTSVTTTLLPLTRIITNTSFGGLFINLTDEKELYVLSPSIRTAEGEGITSPHLRFTLTGIGTHHFSPSSMFIYGVNYSSVFGRELFLPIIGGRWRIDDQWSTTAMLPFSFSINYRPDETLHWKFHIGVIGDRIYFNNNNTYANENSILQFRSNAIKATALLDTKISHSLKMDIEAGILGARKLWISSDDRNIIATSLKPSSYFSIGFRFLLDFSEEEELI